MLETLKIFGEIFVCFLAAVGILYLLRDLYLCVYYRKVKHRLPLLLRIEGMDIKQISRILFEVRDILQNKRAAAYIDKVYLVGKGALNDEEVKRIALSFEDIAEFKNIEDIKE